jgi:hypothetical protein
MLNPKIFELLGINPEFLANRSPNTIRKYLLSYRRTFAIAFHPDVCPDEDATTMLQTVNPFFDDVKHATPEDLERLVKDAVDQGNSTGAYAMLYMEAMCEAEQLRSEADQLRSEVKQLKSELSGGYGKPQVMAELESVKEMAHSLALGI